MNYFEGVEKLLEVWFVSNDAKNSDLRSIERSTWENLLQNAKCDVLNLISNDSIDAYLLSESSMFVSKRRWILKTCGTTTPLKCLEGLLELASNIGFTEVSEVFYSRKNFARPDLQLSPHREFAEEVDYLDTIFEDGRSYCLGAINKECWYLYTFSRADKNIEDSVPTPDQTIEILMHQLDDKAMSVFFKDNCKTAKESTEKSGINKIIPTMVIDDYLFDPCGYSMNGIKKNGEYMTIHITPEADFSYVSFESNVALENYADLISRVVTGFQPSKFVITIFANKASEAYATMKDLELKYPTLSNWTRTDIQCCNFPSYNLLFAQYSRNI